MTRLRLAGINKMVLTEDGMDDEFQETSGQQRLPHFFFVALGDVGQVLVPKWLEGEDQRQRFVKRCVDRRRNLIRLSRLIRCMASQNQLGLEVVSSTIGLEFYGSNFLARLAVNLRGAPAPVRFELLMGQKMGNGLFSSSSQLTILYGDPIGDDSTKVRVVLDQLLIGATRKSWPPDRAERLEALLRRYGAKVPVAEMVSTR